MKGPRRKRVTRYLLGQVCQRRVINRRNFCLGEKRNPHSVRDYEKHT
jgi:hypothetical protein